MNVELKDSNYFIIEQIMRATQSQLALNSREITHWESFSQKLKDTDVWQGNPLDSREYRHLQILRRNQRALKLSMKHWKGVKSYF